MNFFKKLFAKERPYLSARDALRRIRERIKNGTSPLDEALFYSVVGPADRLSSFGQMSLGMGNSIQYVGGPDYDKDVVRFELAAFWMARADSYLFSSHRCSHEAIFAVLSSKFVEVFSVALNMPSHEIRGLLADRLQRYNHLFRYEPSANKILSVVSAAVHDGLRNGEVPTRQIRNEPPPTATVDDLMIVRFLGNMEAAFSPQMRSSIDKVISLARR